MSQQEIAPTFINNSGLPINIETFQKHLPGLNSLKSVLVKSGEQIVLPSITGEWYLQTYLDKEFVEEWDTASYLTGYRIGKFRSKPCALGYYSWVEHDDFDIIYDKEKHTATFIKKSD